MKNRVSTEKTATFYIPWWPSHRSFAHWERLRSSGKLEECDILSGAVGDRLSELDRLLVQRFQRDWRFSSFTPANLIQFLFSDPMRLFPIGMPEEVSSAKQAFEVARTRYEKDCLTVPEPEPTASSDSEFVALDLPATIGGEIFLPEPSLKIALTGYAALGLGVTAMAIGYAVVAGSVAVGGGASVVTTVAEGAMWKPAWDAALLGLRLVTQ